MNRIISININFVIIINILILTLLQLACSESEVLDTGNRKLSVPGAEKTEDPFENKALYLRFFHRRMNLEKKANLMNAAGFNLVSGFWDSGGGTDAYSSDGWGDSGGSDWWNVGSETGSGTVLNDSSGGGDYWWNDGWGDTGGSGVLDNQVPVDNTPGPWAGGYVYESGSTGGNAADLSSVYVGSDSNGAAWWMNDEPSWANTDTWDQPYDPYDPYDPYAGTASNYWGSDSSSMAIDSSLGGQSQSLDQPFDPAYDPISFQSLTLPENNFVAVDPIVASMNSPLESYSSYSSPVDYSPYVYSPEYTPVVDNYVMESNLVLPSMNDLDIYDPVAYGDALYTNLVSDQSMFNQTSFSYVAPEPSIDPYFGNTVSSRASKDLFAPDLKLSASLDASEFRGIFQEDPYMTFEGYSSGCMGLVAGNDGCYSAGTFNPDPINYSSVDGPHPGSIFADPNAVQDPFADPSKFTYPGEDASAGIAITRGGVDFEPGPIPKGDPNMVTAIEDKVQEGELDEKSYELCSSPRAYFITPDIMIFKKTEDDKCTELHQVIAKQSQEDRGFWLIKDGIRIMLIKFWE